MIRFKRKRFSYISPKLLDEKSHILVDGPPYPKSELVLSHWPQSSTPVDLKCDLSTEIAFKWVQNQSPSVRTKNVSNDHFDEDGLIAAFVLISPNLADRHKDLLIDIASAGDFRTYQDPTAAKICLSLGAFSCLETSPWSKELKVLDYFSQVNYLYVNLLDLLPSLLEDIQKYGSFWQEEYHQIQIGKKKVFSQKVIIEEIPQIDLGIVDVKETFAEKKWLSSVGRTMATYSFTNSSRILVLQSPFYELIFRYESWVEFVSRPIAKRIDLTSLEQRLNQMDPAAQWYFNGIDATISKLSNNNPSCLNPTQLKQTIVNFLTMSDRN